MILPASRTLPGLLDALVLARPDAPALSDPARSVTFDQFRAEAITFARALHADGVRPGDKVGLLMGNRVEWLVACFGIQYAGATMVAMNTWYTARELAYVLEHGDVSVLVTADRFLKADYVELLGELGLPGGDTCPLLRHVVVLGAAPSRPGWTGWDDFVSAGGDVAENAVMTIARALGPTDTAYILYTSGSTSRPKGVMLEHGRMVDNGVPVGDRLRFTEEDVLFLPVSLFWGLGCENAIPAAWTHGMHVVLEPSFDVGEALDLIERHRCSAIYSTANIVFMLFDHPDAATRDLSALRKGMAGGSLKVIEQYLPLGCRAYGLTETYGYATLTDADDPIEARVNSFGRPLPGIELKVLSLKTGAPAGIGEIGEVRLRGNVMTGYYKSPEQTAEATDEEGFFKTGDLGQMDAEGFFYFKGRLKEMLKTGGMNVSPAEVEDVLKMHPKVADAFVTGLPDPLREQVVVAVLLPVAGQAIDESDIIAHCRAQLAAFKVPRRLRIVDHAELPFTTTGKIHKQRLPELFGAA